MGQNYELAATVREKVGKGAARSVRRQGMIPAVIYGGNEAPLAINLPHRDVNARIHGGGFFTTIATIEVDGKKIRTLPRDYQMEPVSDRPIHVDFMRIVAGSRVTVEVPVQFINESAAPGIRRGGVLNVVRHRVEVTCPADAIPDHIVADLTGLDITDSLHISAVPLPEGVEPTIHRDFTIASIAAPAGVKEEMRALADAAAAAKVAAAALAEAGDEAAPAAAEGAAGAEAKPAAGGGAAAAPAKGGAKPEAAKK